MPRFLVAPLAALCLSLAPCAHAQRLLVFAAASLKEALDESARGFERATAIPVAVSYAGSNVLARQIEAGAPADVFICADTQWMDHVERRGLLAAGTRRPLLSGELALVAPAASPISLQLAPGLDLRSALGGRRLAMANPDAVPAGRYARAALEALGAWAGVEKAIARTDNVRAALALVARGETPLGIVYRTDALAEPRVRVVALFPEGSHPPIVYSIALTRSASPRAAEFAGYLRGAGRGAFERRGFAVVDR